MRQLLTLASVLFMAVFAQAQVRTYSGVVVSAEDGQTMPGVTVKVVGTSRATGADFDGNFAISAEKGQKLEFTFVGYKPKTITLGELKELTVTLDPDASMLDDVVVVAYGTAKKKDLTGSMTTVNAGDIKNRQVSTVTRALDGQVPGLQVTSSTGQPGSDATIRIRGIGSLNASNEALILVDGVPYPSNLSTINPDDIASVSVLKDAASTSLYGSRAANGIIVITTKRGKSNEKANVALNIRMGFNENAVPHHEWITDPGDYYRMSWTAIRGYFYNQGYDWQTSALGASQNLIKGMLGYNAYKMPEGKTYNDLIDPATGKIIEGAQLLYQEDWFNALTQRSFRQEYNASVTGGSDKVSYYLSLGYLSDPSYVVNSSFERFSSRLNLDAQVNNWLRAGGNMSFTRRISNAPSNYGTSTSTLNAFLFAKMIPSIYPIYALDSDGKVKYDSKGQKVLDYGYGQTDSPIFVSNNPLLAGTNPLSYMTKDKFRSVLDNFSGMAYAEAKFLRDFTARATFSADLVYKNQKSFQNNLEGAASDPSINGSLSQERTTNMVLNANQTITWMRQFGDHHVDALVGHEFFYQKSDLTAAYMQNMFVPGMDDFDNFIKVRANPAGYTAGVSLESYFMRANYNYKDKYYLSGSVRMDGTSKFRYAKWGTFWSVGAAWRMAEENFIRDNADWVNELKLRFSIGTTGNQAVNATDYPYTDLWALSGDNDKFLLSQVWWGNPDLTWESNLKIDAGVDFRLWNKFHGSLDYWRNTTTNLLYAVNRPLSTGQGSLMTNDGKILNWGMELDLNYDIFSNKDLFWSVGLVGSFYKQEILALPKEIMTAAEGTGYRTSWYLWKIGKDQYNIYWGEGAGVDPATGKQLYWKDVKDENGKTMRIKTDNADDQTFYEQGSAIPDFMGGLNTTLRYAGFDLTVNTTFQIGGWVYDSEQGNLTWQGSVPGRNLSKDLLDNTWTPDNTNAKYPMFAFGGADTGYLFEREWVRASYFCLKNVTLGYTLPARATRAIGLSSLRVFASGENLWLSSARTGVDPRQSITGNTQYLSYNQMRTVSFGLNINF